MPFIIPNVVFLELQMTSSEQRDLYSRMRNNLTTFRRDSFVQCESATITTSASCPTTQRSEVLNFDMLTSSIQSTRSKAWLLSLLVVSCLLYSFELVNSFANLQCCAQCAGFGFNRKYSRISWLSKLSSRSSECFGT